MKFIKVTRPISSKLYDEFRLVFRILIASLDRLVLIAEKWVDFRLKNHLELNGLNVEDILLGGKKLFIQSFTDFQVQIINLQ